MDVLEAGSYMEYAMNIQNNQDVSYESSNESMKSFGKEKVRDVRISELEDKLAKAEDRCSVLRNQVAYMKMLYTSSHLSKPSGSDEAVNKNLEGRFCSSAGNTGGSYQPETHNASMPANMTAQSLVGTTIANDPKEAMQLIVNEMTQTVNAVEGSVKIHSNTIEGMMVGSRNKKKRIIKKEDFAVPKPKRIPSNVRDTVKSAIQKAAADKKSTQSVGSKSRVSVNSVKNAKKKLAARHSAGAKNRLGARKGLNLSPKDRLKKVVSERENLHTGQPVQRYNSDIQNAMPHITSSTYLLPTLSYRMKCVPKSYRREFSFHRIPFVLGKSTNKSHNIGAKIQETLSLIKLSRRGLHSAGNLGKKEEFSNLINPKSTREHSISTAEPSSIQATSSSHAKQRGPMTVGATTDYKNYQLRTVLMNLHDEFSKMTENYETLKASLKEKNDPQIAQQVQNLEEELNAKEIEINAFMNLYNEVSQLKDKLMTKGSYQPSTIYKPSSVSVSESTTTLKMTRLLRRIEQFQTQLKTMAYI